ncbi:MAG TPA: FKBP-type peptidyl-prolyl cis-trans isomerase [Candidatus Kapabacteria bacterium]|nr:FKBP-type peptidyl-prolyl cis-trans isomerase [Candidatus Kapabacteria bacterium]
MKQILFMVFAVSILMACNAEAKSKKPIKTEKDSVSYSLGLQWGATLAKDSIQVDIDIIADGLSDALSGKDKSLTMEEAANVLQGLVTKLQSKHQAQQQKEMEEFAKLGEKSKAEGEQFLANNKTKAGVQTTASGLQYKIEKPGSAVKPSPNDKVKVHYKGTLINGKVFDSSYERNDPVEFQLNGVIPGWTEGLQLIGEGGKIILYIPYNLAYGEQGNPPVIPGYSTLVFEVELLKVTK